MPGDEVVGDAVEDPSHSSEVGLGHEVDEATLARVRELADEMLSNAVIEDVVSIEVVE